MLPGFTAVLASSPTRESELRAPAVRLAGLWEAPPTGTCRPSHTDTSCIFFTLWCTDVYTCWTERNPFWGEEYRKTPYPCGICGNPFDFSADPRDW